MGSGAGLGDQALRPAQARRQGEQPQSVGHPGGVRARARHFEAHHPAETVHLRFCQSVTGEVRQAGIKHPGDLRVTGHRLSHRLRRGVLLLNPDDQGAQAAREQRGGLGGDGRAEVLAPVPHWQQQFLRSRQHAGGEIAVSTQVFGGAVDDKIGAQLQRTLVDRRGKGVINRHLRTASVG